MKNFLFIAVIFSLLLHGSLLLLFRGKAPQSTPSLGVRPGFFVFEVEQASSFDPEPTPKLVVPKETVSEEITPGTPSSAKGESKASAMGGQSGGQGNRLVEGTLVPQYPPLSRRKGEEGVVSLRAEVFASGKVGSVEVVKSSGFSRLDSAAVSTLRAATFTPTSGANESTYQVITIQFRLK